MVHWPIETWYPAPAPGTPEDEIADVKSTFETLTALQKEGTVFSIWIVSC